MGAFAVGRAVRGRNIWKYLDCRWKSFLFLAALSIATYLGARYYDIHCVNVKYSHMRLITTWTDGRLGNQMGSYAVLYGLAKLNGYKPYISKDMHSILSPLFRITLPVLDQEMEKLWWTYFDGNDWMSNEYRNMTPRFLWLHGYYCSWSFFHQYRSEILEQFTFHDHIRERARNTLAKLKGSRRNPTYIGVHVRRGDYLRLMPKRYHGVVADKAYLGTAMTHFRSKYQEPVFVVASDGMDWCKETIDASKGDVYFAGDSDVSSPGNDLSLLVHCNHTIMTLGTFGFWAAYLAGGETIYLHNFTHPDSYWRRLSKPESNYLPDWIGIQANISSLLAAPHSR